MLKRKQSKDMSAEQLEHWSFIDKTITNYYTPKFGEWQPIETAPIAQSYRDREVNRILIRYIKNGKMKDKRRHQVIVLEAYGCKNHYGDGVTWADALGSPLTMTGAPFTRNLVTHWMPLPPEPYE